MGHYSDAYDFEHEKSRKAKGGTRKIAGPSDDACSNAEHLPATAQYFPPGTYEHTCPGCGHITRFVVPKTTL